jgi:excisionase family DNA binding protein
MRAKKNNDLPVVTREASHSIDPLLLSLPEAASVAGLTVWQLRGLIAKQEIQIVKVGRKFHIRRATLLRWAERAEGFAA